VSECLVEVRKYNRKGKVVGVVMPAEEAKTLEQTARELDVSVSWFCKQAIRRAVEEHTTTA
jgi:hypothetical protein